MAAGTISITNGGKTVSGVGTSFTTELKPDDFFYFDAGETTYMVVVDSVASDTSLTMLKAFRGPTSNGLSWGVVPRKGLALVAAQSVKDMAEYMRSSVLDKVNWQGVFSELDQVTVTLLDGSVFTGPSWKKISDQLKDVDLDAVQAIADQVHADAAQVSADKATLTPLMAQAHTDAQQVAADKSVVTQAKTDAVAAKGAAETARDQAQQAAGSVPSDANIKAWLKRMIRLGEVQWHHGSRATIPTADGWIAADGQLLDSTFSDLWAIKDSLPGAALADWTNSGDAAAPWKYRTRYVKGSQAEFRAPDFNGVVTLGGVTSIGHLFLAGAGGVGFDDTNNAQVYGQTAPNITGAFNTRKIGSNVQNTFGTVGAFNYVQPTTGTPLTNLAAGSASNIPEVIQFSASQSDGTYGRNSAWLYPHNVSGVWIIRAKYPTF